MQVEHNQETSTNCKARHWFGLDKKLLASVLNFIITFSIRSSCRQTDFYFPTCYKALNVSDHFHRQSTQHSKQQPRHLLKILKFPFQKIFNPLDPIPQIRSRPFSFIGFPYLIVVEQHLAFPGKQPIGVVGVIWAFKYYTACFVLLLTSRSGPF